MLTITFLCLFFLTLIIIIAPGWLSLFIIFGSIGGSLLAIYLQEKFNIWLNKKGW